MHPATIPIIFYQRYISPHKGFRCCYGVIHETCSCSEYGKRAIERHGLMAGWKLTRRRLRICTLTYEAVLEGRYDAVLKQKKIRVQRKKKNEAGEADLADCAVMPCYLPDIGSCGGSAGEVAGDVADSVSLCDCDIGACDLSI